MARRFLTAREQVEMLAPWRVAAEQEPQVVVERPESPQPGYAFHDMSGVGEELYDHPEDFFFNGMALGANDIMDQMRAARDNPDHPVTVHRAVPPGHNGMFNTGDWVTPSREFAQEFGGDNPVITTTVPASTLSLGGDSLYEYGYHGPSHRGRTSSLAPRRVAAYGLPEGEFRGWHMRVLHPGSSPNPNALLRAYTHPDKDNNSHVGELMWDNTYGDGVVDRIKVHPDHQRKGLATAMFDYASQLEGYTPPTTEGSEYESPEGRAWGKAMQNRQAAAPEDLDPLLRLLDPVHGRHVPYEPPPSTPSPPPDPDRYYKHLIEQPDRTHTAHAWLPTDVVDHYREYDRDPGNPDYQAVKRAVSEQGVKLPLWISANNTHGLLVEGNNRLQAAKELGIPELPVRFTHNDPVMSNEGNAPVPHHPVVKDWLAQNRHKLAAAPTTPWLPTRRNPDPSNPYDDEHYIPERPRINWEPEEYAQERLPGTNWPRGEKPTTLYRGLHIDLDHPAYADHPNVQGIKQILYGDEDPHGLFPKPQTQGDLYPHPHSSAGKALSKHVLDFVEDIGQDFGKHFEEWTPENERTRIPFSKIHDTHDPTWLGRHWSTNPEIADDFAKQPTPDAGHPPPRRGLSVLMEAGWDGRGEDLSRPNVGRGTMFHEDEINLTPGTNLDMKGVHIRHPHMLGRATGGGEWHNVLGEPQIRTARA